MKTSLFFWIIVLCTQLCWSQADNQIRGAVETVRHEGIGAATILLMNPEDSTLVKVWISESDGSFFLRNLTPGHYYLQVSYIGFKDFTSKVFELAEGVEYVHPVIFLEERLEMLEQVVVKATRPLVEIKPDRTIFNIDGSINAIGSDALDLLKKAPGVLVDNSERIMLMGRSGVTIYVDEKPVYLDGDDLPQYLKTIPSIEIDAFEIITNPPAKYESAGNAGIINIRLKINKNKGLLLSLNTSYNIGTFSKYNNALNFNYRNDELNVFGQYSNTTGLWRYNDLIYREQSGMAFDQAIYMKNDGLNHRYRLGVDYALSWKSTVGVLIEGYDNDGTFHNDSRVDIYQMANSEISKILYSSSDFDQHRKNHTINLNYTFKDGLATTFNVDADYGRFRHDNNFYQPNVYVDPTDSETRDERIFASNTPTLIDIYTFKVDYERAIFGGHIGFGGKFSSVSTDNTYDFFDVIDQEQILNSDRSNTFDYLEEVSAAYFSFQTQLAKFSLSTGLRVEHTYSKGSMSDNKFILYNPTTRKYWSWLPSGGLTYQMNDQNAFRFNYHRRLERPSYQDLNPFEFKFDELTFLRGNALLNPQYSHSFSLTHTLHSKFNTTLSYSVTDDLITRINDTLNEIATLSTYVNLDKQKVVSLSLSYPFTVNRWWNVFANVSAYQTENRANFEPGKYIDITATGIRTYATNTFLLPRDLKLELSGFHQSPFVSSGNFEFDAYYSVDVGLSKKLLKDRANLRIAVTDIFKTNKISGVSKLGDLKMTIRSRWESRQFRVNFNYLFGNQQVKVLRSRKTGIEDEQKRIKQENQD